MRYGLILALAGILVLGFKCAAQAGEWVGVLTGTSCAENGELCPMSDKGKDEVVLLADDKSVFHLEGKEQSYLLNHFGHKVRITGELKDEMGKQAINVESLQHLAVVVH